MSTHNILTTEMKCPRCNRISEMEIEGFFGFGNLDPYVLGDKVFWLTDENIGEGSRSNDANIIAAGYVIFP